MPPDSPIDPLGILDVLNRHGARFILIGGVAGNVHGSPIPTEDVDVTPEPKPENLERLAAALRELNARLRTGSDPDGVDFDVSAKALETATIWTLVTDRGDLDVVLEPAGTYGYDDLRRDAAEVDLGDGLVVWVASVADLIRTKEAAGRAKDQIGLPALRAVLARNERAR